MHAKQFSEFCCFLSFFSSKLMKCHRVRCLTLCLLSARSCSRSGGLLTIDALHLTSITLSVLTCSIWYVVCAYTVDVCRYCSGCKPFSSSQSSGHSEVRLQAAVARSSTSSFERSSSAGFPSSRSRKVPKYLRYFRRTLRLSHQVRIALTDLKPVQN